MLEIKKSLIYATFLVLTLVIMLHLDDVVLENKILRPIFIIVTVALSFVTTLNIIKAITILI